MSTSWRARPVLLLAVLVAGLATPVAGAQPKKGDEVQGDNPAAVEEARKYFNEGVRLSAAGKVVEALDSFQKAYDVIPNWRILYNIGQTSRHVRDYARSLRAFERYLAEGKDIPKARRAEVDKEIATLKPLVGRLEISANVEGAEVFVDDKSVGTTPIAEPVLANGGKRRVRATKEGMAPFTDEVTVKGGGSQKLELDLKPASEAAPTPTATAAPTATTTAPPPDPGPPRDWSGYATAAWIGAAVFTAGAVATGTIALVESVRLGDSAYAGPDRRPPEDSPLTAQGERIEVLAVVTDVLVGAAVVSAGLGVYFSFFAGGSSPPPPAKSGRAPAREVTVRVSPKGATLVGTF